MGDAPSETANDAGDAAPALAPDPAAAMLLWWEQVSTCALVGSGRRPVPPVPAELSSFVAGSSRPSDDPEGELLDQLALGAVWQAAGVMPAADVTSPPPAPAETRPPAPARALALLELILSQPPGGANSRSENLSLWARECDRVGARVTSRVLPALLDVSAADRSVALRVAPVLGERGRWLASLNPAWRRLASPEAVADWPQQDPGTAPGPAGHDDEAGFPSDWLAWPVETQVSRLLAYRAVAPLEALSHLEDVWGTAPAKDRTRYLEVLVRGLNEADEPFLEAALDDRAAAVRARAAELLNGLPRSARAQRMAARLRPLLRVDGRLRKVVTVSLPPEPDKAGIRDGLGGTFGGGVRRPQRSRRGQDLIEIVAGAPVSVWEQTGYAPAGLIGKLADTAERDEVLIGLRLAAEAQRHTEWATALLELGDLSPGLLELLDETTATRLSITRLARALPDERFALVSHLLPGWNAEVSAAVVRTISREDTPAVATSGVLTSYGSRFHPSATPALQTWLGRLDRESPVRAPLASLVTTLTFQQSIREAFA